MAMKFWFGKKEAERNGVENVSNGVSTLPDRPSEGGQAVPSLFVAPKEFSAVSPTRNTFAQPVAAVEGNGAQSAEKKAPVSEESKNVLSPIKKVSETVAETSSMKTEPLSAAIGNEPKPLAEGAKTVLRPVGLPQRLVAVPSASPAAASGDGASTAAAGARPVFGFRAKVSAPPAAASPAPAAATSPEPSASALAQPTAAKGDASRQESENAMIRPKVDQRALYYELMNGLYDAVLILDDQGHVVDSNVRVKSVLGYSREDTWDLPIEKVIPGMTSQMFEHLKRNLSANNHVLIDARCFRQDETTFAGEVGVSTLTLTRGTNMVFAIRNVERRKSAMEELRKSSTALQVALAPAFVCDTEGFFQIVNQALMETFGIPDETQAKSVRFVDLMPDATRFFLRASCGEKLHETLQIQTPEGVSVKLELSLSPIQSGDKITAVAGSVQQV